MSPNVGNFVHDLVEMAKAMEELPGAKQELANALKANADLLDIIQQKELRIIDLKNEVDDKASIIRSLEVARDDAELRFLEADDKHTHSLMALRSIQTSLGESLKVLDPQPEPVPEPMVPNDQSHAASLRQSEDVRPSTGWLSEQQGSGDLIPLGDHAAPYAHTPPEGQREPDPIATSEVGNVSELPIASGSGAGHTDDASTGQRETLPTAALPIDGSTAETQSASPAVGSQPPQPDKPYAGKFYYDHPVWVPLEDWLAGGGTEHTYNWRPPFVSGAFPSSSF